ncbi:MAG: hypothetical protein LBT37_06030 [Lactobacillaceae bacterium]|nr:hypothetical protein [Lactobacillaceae bacterium]
MDFTEASTQASNMLKLLNHDFETSYIFNKTKIRLLVSNQDSSSDLPLIFVIITVNSTEIMRMIELYSSNGSIRYNPYWPDETKDIVLPIIRDKNFSPMPFWNDLKLRIESLTLNVLTKSDVSSGSSGTTSAFGNIDDVYPMTVANWTKTQEKIGPNQQKRILRTYDKWHLEQLIAHRKTIRFTPTIEKAKTINFSDVFKK